MLDILVRPEFACPPTIWQLECGVRRLNHAEHIPLAINCDLLKAEFQVTV
ncbi:MAG: hypothetical protein WA459_08655 [Stellaceae bacterium]